MYNPKVRAAGGPPVGPAPGFVMGCGASAVHDPTWSLETSTAPRGPIPLRDLEIVCPSLPANMLPPGFKGGDAVCVICGEQLLEGETSRELRQLPCAHTFHANCVDPWLTQQDRSCPTCRAVVEPPDSSLVPNTAQWLLDCVDEDPAEARRRWRIHSLTAPTECRLDDTPQPGDRDWGLLPQCQAGPDVDRCDPNPLCLP